MKLPTLFDLIDGVKQGRLKWQYWLMQTISAYCRNIWLPTGDASLHTGVCSVDGAAIQGSQM